MKCMIVDDEPLSREGLERYVERVTFLEHTGSYENALKASEAMQKTAVDLIFLDIQMPYLTGIDFLKNLVNRPLVIFHTAFPNYALESYQLDVIDYLVKPITFERFFKAVSKAHEYFSLRNGKTEVQAGDPSFIFIKCEQRYEKIVFDEVMHIEAMQNYSVIQTTTKKLTTLTSLKKMEELLPPNQFMRVHKSYIIPLAKVDTIEGNQVIVGEKTIPIGKSQKEAVFKRLIPGT